MTVTNFVWDELSDNVMFETDENDDPTAVYTHLPGRFGELLSQDRNGTSSYYHYDGKHSTRTLTDENQNVTDTFVYSAYGEEIARTGATTNPFGYKGAVGYYTNPETDDVYVRARTYQPTLGRWLSKDPLGFVDGPSLYRAYFVPNGTDPLGLLCQPKKICGVSSFVVTYQFIHQHKNGGTSLYVIQTDITFKKDAKHDPALCQFRQFVKDHELSYTQDFKENGKFKTLSPHQKKWKDDNYSRADDKDGDKSMTHKGFLTYDGPGANKEIEDWWYIKFQFTTQQAVYDTDRKVWVAATPAINIKVLGSHDSQKFRAQIGFKPTPEPRKYTPTPAGSFTWNKKLDGGTVKGIDGQKVFGTYK